MYKLIGKLINRDWGREMKGKKKKKKEKVKGCMCDELVKNRKRLRLSLGFYWCVEIRCVYVKINW